MKNFWLSWFGNRCGYELHWPWWISGYRMDGDDETGALDTPSICAAVRAPNEAAAKALIIAAYDEPPGELEWRFCNERPDDWSPFNERFPKADWMQWPAAFTPALRGEK